MKPKIVDLKTPDVVKALARAHEPDKWCFLDEIRIGGGYGKDSEQRIDGVAIHYYTSKRNMVRIFEIKVSVADFKHEISKPKKRRHGLRLSNEFIFVTPKNLLKIEDIPPECGLWEVDEDYKISVKIKAPYTESVPTWNFVGSLCRRHDKPRLEEWSHIMGEDGKLKNYGSVALKVLAQHVKKWQGFTQGNKETADKIASAMLEVYHETIDRVEAERKIK